MIERWGNILIGVLFGLLSAGLILLVSKPKPGQAILLRPPPTPMPVVVNIDGGVRTPGVYALPPRSRVLDAVESAGGFSEAASPGSINLAAILEDGAHIYIPILNPQGDEDSGGEGKVLVRSESGEIISLVNINQASLEALISLPGIGPVTAEKIILFRESQAFIRIEDIQKVPGIGPSTFEQIRPYLTVGE
jgi:competence protein ComEA